MRKGLVRRMQAERWSLERLEGRSLLSVLKPMSAPRGDLPDRPRASAEVATMTIARASGRITADGNAAETMVRPPHQADNAGAPTAGRTAAEGAAARRPGLAGMTARELIDPVANIPRDIDPTTSSVAIDPERIGGAGEVGHDPESAGLATPSDWMPLVSTLPQHPGRSSNRAASTQEERDWVSPGSFGGAVLATIAPHELPPGSEPTGRESAIPDGANLDHPAALPIVSTTADPGAESGPWVRLIEGAAPPDWQAIDGELRHVLAGMHDLADAPEMMRAGWPWALWLAAGTVLYVLTRSRSDRRRPPRRLGTGASWRAGQDLLPDGPWPLGMP